MMDAEKFFSIYDKQTVQANVQTAYDILISDFRTYKQIDYASFIVLTLMEANQGVVNIPKLNALFGASSDEDRIHRMRVLADEIEDTLTIDEFPGYDDWWFGFRQDGVNSFVLMLYLGMPEWGFYYSEERSTDKEFVPLISDFKRVFTADEVANVDISSNLRVEIEDQQGTVSLVSKENGLPFHAEEQRFFLNLMGGSS